MSAADPPEASGETPQSSTPAGGPAPEALRERWLHLAREALPARAASEPGWPVRFDHCFMRIALDHAVGQRWTDVIPSPAYTRADADQFARAVGVAEAMLAGGPEATRPLNDTSKRWRREAKARDAAGE